MSDSVVENPTADPHRRDRGVTLVEVAIGVVLSSMLVSAVAAAVFVVLRANPNTTDRIDDARSTRGLSTMLSHDTMSTPPYEPEATVGGALGGFDIDTAANGNNNDCGGPGQNIVHLQWTELANDGTDETYVANYRFVTSGSEARVHRLICVDEGSGFTSLGELKLTPILDAGSPPSATIARGASGDVDALEFRLVGRLGEDVVISTSSRNPADFFP